LSILEQVIRYTGGEVTAQAVDEALGLVSEEIVSKFVDAILERDLHTVLDITEKVYIERGDYDTFLNQLIEYSLEKRNSLMTALSMEFFEIMKELKYAEEKFLIAKLLFANLVEKLRSTVQPKSEKGIGVSDISKQFTEKETKNIVKSTESSDSRNRSAEVNTISNISNIKPNSENASKDVLDKVDKTVDKTTRFTDHASISNPSDQKGEQRVGELSQSQENSQNVPSEKDSENKQFGIATKAVLEDLKLNGDLSIFVGLSLATVYENEDSIRIVFDESKQFSYEIIKEKKDEIAILYKNKTGLNRPVIVEISSEIQDPVVEKLKMLFGPLE